MRLRRWRRFHPGLNLFMQDMERCVASFPKADGEGIWLLEVKPPLYFGHERLTPWRWVLWSHGRDETAEGHANSGLECYRQAEERAKTLGVAS